MQNFLHTRKHTRYALPTLRQTLRSAFCILLWISPLYGQAQEADNSAKTLSPQGLDNATVLRRFEERFIQMDSLMNDARRVVILPDTRDGAAVYQSLDSLYEAKADNEVAAFRRRNGLEVTGQIYQRLDNSIGLDEDDQYSSYSTKFQGELGWNIFNSSFLQRKQAIRHIRLSNEYDRIKARKEISADQWATLEQVIKRKYDKYISIILYHRLVNTDILDTAYRYALEHDRIANDRLLDVMNDRMDIEHALLQSCSIDSVRDEPLFLPEAVVMAIDTASIRKNLERENPDLLASMVREEMLDAKIKLTNYAHEMRLTPFVRASHYLRTSLPSSTNIDLGVRFTFPLYDSAPKTRRAMQTEQVIETINREAVRNETEERCQILLTRFERLNNTIQAEKDHLDKMEKYISLRREAYLSSVNGYNYINRMEEYNSFLRSVERLYRLMLARDLCLLDIRKELGYTDTPVTIN